MGRRPTRRTWTPPWDYMLTARYPGNVTTSSPPVVCTNPSSDPVAKKMLSNVGQNWITLLGENRVGTGSGTRLSGRENTGPAASLLKLRWLPASTISYDR